MHDKLSPEDLEKNMQFAEAAFAYLEQASENKNAQQTPELFMKAARCFEKSEPWRFSYLNWVFCRDELHARLKENNFSVEDDNLEERRSRPFLNRIEPYRMYDHLWESPEEKEYIRFLGKGASEEDKDRHRVAWVLDFAGTVAERYNMHKMASDRYNEAGNAWLLCINFPGHRRIAAKFFTQAIKERIVAIGHRAQKTVTNMVKNILRHTIENPNFIDQADQSEHFEDYRFLANYFGMIHDYSKQAGMNKIATKCKRLENKILRIYYKKRKENWKHGLNLISYLFSGNGTRPFWLFGIVVIVIAIAIFPALYFYFGNVVHSDETTAGLYEIYYFSIVTLTTLGYGDFHPKGPAMLFSVIEALSGYILLGVFLYLLSKKFD